MSKMDVGARAFWQVLRAGLAAKAGPAGRLRQGEHRTPPAGYPQDRSQYAVPETYEFPIDKKHIHPALTYFHTHKFRSAEERKRAAGRILRAAKKFGVEVSKDSDVARAAGGS